MDLSTKTLDELYILAIANFDERTSRISTDMSIEELEALVDKTNDERHAMNDFYRHVSWALRDKKKAAD